MVIQTEKIWMFTVDTDGVYTCDTYEGHSHPYPDPELIACAKFCAPNGSIEDIVENLGEWEFFTDDATLQEEIKKVSMDYFVKNAFYREQIYPNEFWYPAQKPTPYGMHRNVYGAIHIWKVPTNKVLVHL